MIRKKKNCHDKKQEHYWVSVNSFRTNKNTLTIVEKCAQCGETRKVEKMYDQ